MSEKIFKPQTYGRFELTGFLTGLTTEAFNKDLAGKNNPNWIYSRMNVRLTDGGSKNFYLTVQDGYSKVNGKDIYVRTPEKEQMIVKFADRMNEAVRQRIEDNSFIKVGVGKVKKIAQDKEGNTIMENGQPKEIEVWDYKRFLTQYDLVNYLSTVLHEGLKVFISGNVKYSEYNGKVNREYTIQRILFLPKDDVQPCKFVFKQNVLLDSTSVDASKFETENIANIKAMVYQKKKKDEYMVLPLNMVVRATDQNKDAVRTLINKYLTVQGDTIRRINLEGLYNLGFISTQLTEDDLSPEMLELLEEGLYTKEELLKKYANRQKVDEMQIARPILSNEGTGVDMSDTDYTKEDLVNLTVEPEVIEQVEVQSNATSNDELDFLKELDL